MRIQDPGWKKFGSGINIPVVAGSYHRISDPLSEKRFRIRIKVMWIRNTAYLGKCVLLRTYGTYLRVYP